MIAAFVPSAALAVGIAGLLALEAGAAAGANRWAHRALLPTSWLVTAACSIAGTVLAWSEPAGVRMLALVLPLFFGMKIVCHAASRRAGGPRLGFWRWASFTFGWPGMDPARFARAHPKGPAGWRRLAAFGALWSACGVGLLFGARLLWTAGQAVPATVAALVALSLMLHFGLFGLLAALWRRVGFDADRLFLAPLASTSLTEFWGRRWNVPFIEMVRLSVYAPLVGRFGASWASLAAFLISGLFHELAVSVPAQGGYGLPFAYFLLHAALLATERRRRAGGSSQRGWVNRTWTLAWVALPAPLLFHPWFVKAIVWPLLA